MAHPTSVHAPQDSGVPQHARDFGVNDRVVVITGAGQGIGRELSRQFAAAGATVVVADINRANADRVQGEIETSDGKAIAVAVDIGDKASVETMAAYAVTKLGRIDVLINNAAIFASLQKRRFWEIPVDEWERVMHVNVTGVFLSVCAVVPTMRQQKWGRIINISSAPVPKGVPNFPRGMVPSDLAGLAMFLSTPASGFITGQTIACDGGMTHSS